MDRTAQYMAKLHSEGVHLLNFWRLAPTEIGHAASMLDLLALPLSSTVVDLGSGTGEFARLAMDLDPSLQFILVNNNEWQLQQSPQQATAVLGDMAATGLPDACADAVVLAYALGHGDVVDVLEEAHRLLQPGGKLLLHDVLAPTHVEAADFRAALNYQTHNPVLLNYWLSAIGFDFVEARTDEYLAPGATVAAVAPLVTRMGHGVGLYTKSDRPHRFAGRRAALQLSGGKDSVACLYMLKPFLRKYITCYWLNTGDGIPETLAVIDELRAWVPNFVEIRSDVKAWREEHGLPSDLVPARSHDIGLMYGMSGVRISNRFDCCAANLMRPMHQRMLDDGIDLVIRGTKLYDTGKLPFEGWADGVEVWLPLRDYTHDDVFALLRDAGAPVSRVYQFATGISAPECMGCTAWWDDKKAAYLKAWHPEQYTEYRKNLQYIAGVVSSHMADLYAELTEI